MDSQVNSSVATDLSFPTPAAEVIDPARYAELCQKGWKFLTYDERKEYKQLKDALGIVPKKRITPAQRARIQELQTHNVPITPAALGSPLYTLSEKKDVLFRCFGLMNDSDDKGRFNQLITDDALLESLDMDQIYTKALWLVSDGGSRRVVKNAFNRE